jgi:N-acetylglucosaminyldiphosphoundecaprenol N-acetyl-beta-D-mannosaminyltransferase
MIQNDSTQIDEIQILGIDLPLGNKNQLLCLIEEMVKSGRKGIISSGNVLSLNLAYENDWFRDFLNSTNYIRLDGSGVRIGAKILGFKTPPRITWADFAWDLADLAASRNFALFFLGAKPGITDQAAEYLKARHPKLRVVGTQHGYFDKNANNEENVRVIHRINENKPDILIIGMGMPIQERWLIENRDKLDVSVILTGGAVFDYVSGNLKRAPKWMTDNGLEWLGRLLIEPRRLWKRYLIGNPVFLWRVIKQKMGLIKFDNV